MKRFLAFRISGNFTREETIDGKTYGVAPVTILAEGVHQGISAPGVAAPRSLYPSAFFEALRPQLSSIDGIAVTCNHPQTESELVSARSAEGMRFVVGYIANSRVENNKLKAEAYIDLDALAAISPDALEALRNGEPMNVSWGGWPETTESTGAWHNEDYDEIVSNARFDHLALLPNDRGACSWDDGCGVRAAQQAKKSEESKMNPIVAFIAGLLFGAKETVNEAEARVTALINAKGSPFKEENRKALMELPEKFLRVLEASFDEIRTQLWGFINGLDSPEFINFLEDPYEGYFIYRSERRSGMAGTSSTTLYKRSYSVDASTNKVVVADDAVEVIKKIEYVPVGSSTANSTHHKESAVKEQLIAALIAHDRTPFTEDDRAYLTGLAECRLKVMTEKLDKPAATPVAATTPAAAPAEPKKEPTLQEYIAAAPKEIGTALQALIDREKATKEAVIDKIVAMEGCPFKKEELADKDLSELTKIAALAGVKTDPVPDFSGQQGTRPPSGTEIPPMPSSAPAPRK